MLSITSNPYNTGDYTGFDNGGSIFYGSKITSMSSSQKENKVITIMTDEGDRVTLSADSQRQESYMTYSGLVRVADTVTQVQGKDYIMEVNSELSITIEGNLSEQELKDIQKSIKTIDKIIHAALSGNTKHALSMTQDVSSMESISNFSASLETEKAVSFEQQTIVGSQTPFPEQTKITSAPDSISNEQYGNITDEILKALSHQGVMNKNIIKPLNKYLSKLFEEFSKKYAGPEKSTNMEKIHHIRSEILEALEKEAREEQIDNIESGPEQEIEETLETVTTENDTVPDLGTS